MKNNFAKTVKALRKEKNLTQLEFACKLNASQRKISYWESGKTEPNIDELWDISDFFDVSVDELIGKEK